MIIISLDKNNNHDFEFGDEIIYIVPEPNDKQIKVRFDNCDIYKSETDKNNIIIKIRR